MLKPLPTDPKLYTGIDIGGTKIHIADSSQPTVHHYRTADFRSPLDLLEKYFAMIGRRSARMALAMAGPRNDTTGDIQLTNGSWPAFRLDEAQKQYPGTTFYTANDMLGAAAGVLGASSMDLRQLKPGAPTATGTKIVVTISTGLAPAAAILDGASGRHVLLATEGGHIGLQPKNSEEMAYLQYLQQKHPETHGHISAERALAGKYGIDSLADFLLAQHPAPALAAAIASARKRSQATGTVLRAYATEGKGKDRQVAAAILAQLGAMLGSVLHDFALCYKATGGIYLIGSVSTGLAAYFAENTAFCERTVNPGAAHDSWLARIPLYLVTDPHIGAKGALRLAEQMNL